MAEKAPIPYPNEPKDVVDIIGPGASTGFNGNDFTLDMDAYQARAVSTERKDFDQDAELLANLGIRVTDPAKFNKFMRTVIAVLGLCGEAGEVAEHFKKHYGHGHKLNVNEIAKELGDNMWYNAVLTGLMGSTWSWIGGLNIWKLFHRYAGQSLTKERSVNRVD